MTLTETSLKPVASQLKLQFMAHLAFNLTSNPNEEKEENLRRV